MERALLGAALLMPLLMLLAWLSGRLLGGRPPWWLSLLSASAGLVAGGALAASIAVQAEGSANTANPLVIWVTALLVTMGMSALFELLAHSPTGRRGPPVVPVRPLTAFRHWAVHVRRMLQIVRLLIRHRLLSPHRHRGLTQAARLRAALEEAGGVFVKFGQVLSTRVDLLPPEVIAELSQLQNQVQAVPAAAITAVLAEEFGDSAELLFADFAAEPLAAASIAQVHSARLHSGEPVVVKVQRPGIDDVIACDLGILQTMARAAEAWTAWGRELRVREQSERFAEVLREELDFRVEARNLAAVAAANGEEPALRLPAVYPQLSTSRVLVLEHLDGVSVREAGLRLRALSHEPVALARGLLRAMLRQILVGGTFHADPHPGNLLVLPSGELALIDFGLVGRLDALQQAALAELLVALERRDPAMLRDALLALVELRDRRDGERLERALSQVLVRGLAPGARGGAELFQELFRLLLEFGMAFPPDVNGLFRALITLEGTLLLLAPEFSALDEARALASNWFHDELAPASAAETARGELVALLPVLRRLPRRLDRISAAAERGELSVNVRLFADERDVRVVARLVGQVVLAGASAALGTMGVLLLGTTGGPALTATVGVLHALGYSLLAASIALFLRVIVLVTRGQG